MHAAGGRIESVDGAILRAGEDASAIDGGLRTQHGRVGKGEDPLGRELGYIGGGESGIGGGLEAGVIEAGRPAGPVGAVLPRCQAGGTEIGDFVPAPLVDYGLAQVVGQRLALVGRKPRGLGLHHAALEGPQDRDGGKRFQHVHLRDARTGLCGSGVTGGAVLLKELRGEGIVRGARDQGNHQGSHQEYVELHLHCGAVYIKMPGMTHWFLATDEKYSA